MSRNIIICADGTWNRDETVIEGSGRRTSTNVSKLAVSLAPEDEAHNEQLLFYMEGVGSKDTERLSGGAFGWGLSKNILRAYTFICQNYKPGDRLYLFGFSRGAYTVRSLAGLIANSGVVKDPSLATKAMELYREKNDPLKSFSIRSRIFRTQNSHVVSIHFLGVWDTVGSMGIPLMRHRIAKFLGWEWDFHSTDFKQKVLHASHAVSIDERRSKFRPDLKDKLDGSQIVEMWFHGVHSDIGGGYEETGLSNITLQWMIDQAKSKGLCFVGDWEAGLGIHEEALPSNLLGKRHQVLDPSEYVRHEEWKGFFKLLDRLKNLKEGYRREVNEEMIHDSVKNIESLLKHHFAVNPEKGITELPHEIVEGTKYRIDVDAHPTKVVRLPKVLAWLSKWRNEDQTFLDSGAWEACIGNWTSNPMTFIERTLPPDEDSTKSMIRRFTLSFTASSSGRLLIGPRLPWFGRWFVKGRAIVRVYPDPLDLDVKNPA